MVTSNPAVDPASLATNVGTSTFRSVNGLRLHARVAGDPDDPLVVLLHGFPEFWYGWHEMIEPLVEAGFRVVVPDQRGYNRSEKPQSVRAYRRPELARDVAALIDTEDRATADIVGHDWGGIVAWDLALCHPEVVDRLSVVNAPHPTAFRRQLLSNPEQLRRSWYAYSFQLPWLPERLCRYDDFRLLERALRGTSAPGTFSDADLERYRRAWRREDALEGMIHWYRATARYPSPSPRDRVDAPTLVAWGEADTALVRELALDSYDHCRDGHLELFADASHWLQHEKTDRLVDLLCEHL
ncbi:alpha/beta fold hydrolase [Natronobacterium gregoryi]|uniref:Alpha/beta hydrolase n=2 Tax=Natronobacterium gregoryi TaxID=44930 RepID=L0AEA7_NATGS|nr:alpha/beta hydrolase [Natronobacterium gregoryi]AFZ71482.1 putative hydrolase or acyltransferase of alpha/beta superfamily [Natronobacterium gregoryi SP2]ELY66784.1 Soluble epoxide hydrolase [Natronobacterium gregoryi SP2]PLK17880.1 alpha/beta hydrolase [Natronobacterium gregoryi SP2]SFJ74912.1 Pimeloyl-ACP methyl ester carboxylesterase [Natronobacterium gregoryi]